MKYDLLCESTDVDAWFSEKIRDVITFQIDNYDFSNCSNWKLENIWYTQIN